MGSEWWLIRRWNEKPAKHGFARHIKTVRSEEEIKNLSYLKGLPPGWYSVLYGRVKKGVRGIKSFPARTFWHIVIKDKKKVAERWTGIVGDIRFVKTVEL